MNPADRAPVRPSSSRGVALLMVITALVTLLIVAVPFAISMRKGQERTTSELARNRALFEAELLVEAMKHAMSSTHPAQEQVRWDQGERDVASDPWVDGGEEIALGDDFRRQVEQLWSQAIDKDAVLAGRLQGLKSRGLGPMNDDQGSIWTGVVDDANGRVNVNGCSPFLLANLLGLAILTEDVDASSPDIPVTWVTQSKMPSLTGFPRDGGFIRIGRETIRYQSFDGDSFRGCERGALPETPLGDNGQGEEHPKNTPVIDYTAYKLATHLIAARPGSLTPFRTMEDLRSVAGWGAGGALPRPRLDELAAFTTLWSRRETGEGWLAPQIITNEVPDTQESNSAEEVSLQDLSNDTGTTAYFNPGTIVRVTDGRQTAYQSVANIGDASGSQIDRIVTLAGPVGAGIAVPDGTGLQFKGGESTLAAYAPYPININTAPVEVIYACIANLHLRLADSAEKVVVPELAASLARRIVEERVGELQVDDVTGVRSKGPFRGVEDWGQWLRRLEEETVITLDQRAALYYNGINPHSALLAFGTAPWCYRTLDVYHFESRVAINNRGGEQVATATVREVAEIGSDTRSSWILDSQADFELRLTQGSGAKWTATYPRGVNFRSPATAHIQPALRGPKAVLFGAYPSTERSSDGERGEVRLEPARIRMPGNTIRAVANHFDSSLFTEGWRTDYGGPFTERVRGSMRGNGDTYGQPFTLSFWWKSYSDANWTAFDCGMEKFQNRYAIFVTEGLEGPELVFRVCAATRVGRGAEIYVPLERINYRPGIWYHIQVSCRGEDPTMMELLIDGVSVGRRRTFTTLKASLSEDADEVVVESTDGFSPSGALLIGDEVVEYETLNQESFRDCLRGARGTNDLDKLEGQGRAWPSGTAVRQLGYSAALLTDVMQGGSSLASDLGQWRAVWISNRDDTTTYTPSSGGGTSGGAQTSTIYEFQGVAGDTRTFSAVIQPLWTSDPNDPEAREEGAAAFGESGIALMGCYALDEGAHGQTSDDGYILGGWEFVYYTRGAGSDDVINIERDTSFTREGWTETENMFLASWGQKTETTTTSGGGGGGGGGGTTTTVTTTLTLNSFLIPISIAGTNTGGGDDYLDPTNPDHLNILARHGKSWDGNDNSFDIGRDEGDNEALCVIGLPKDDDGGNRIGCEAFRYGSIWRGGGGDQHFVACDDFIDTIGSLFYERAWTPMAGRMITVYSDPETAAPEGTEDSRSGDDDVPPPGEDAIPPESDPETDTSGAGDSEAWDEGVLSDEVVQAARDAQEDAPDEPDQRPFSDVDYGWPAWGAANGRVKGVFRGVRNSQNRAHKNFSTGDRQAWILPCFRVDEGEADDERNDSSDYRTGRARIHEGGRPVGRNDRVTLTDGKPEGARYYELMLRWADPYSRWVAPDSFPDARIGAVDTQGLASFREDPRGHARMLCFPCGELPDDLPLDMEFGRSVVSSSDTVTAFLDELNIFRHEWRATPRLFLIDDQGVSDSAQEIRFTLYPAPQGTSLEGIPGFHSSCGVVSIDGELIVYQGVRNELEGEWVLEQCIRGVLGTEPKAHGRGGYGRFVTDLPVAVLEGNLTVDGYSLQVMPLDSSWPREGLVRVVSDGQVELIHYTRRSDEQLIVPESLDVEEGSRGRGILRGRFGTDATDHDGGDLVFFQPFRYWDRYTPRRTEDNQGFSGLHDHPETSYLEVGKRVGTGYWHRLAWKEDLQGSQGGTDTRRRRRGGGADSAGYLDVVVLARFSPRVPWDSDRIIDLRSQEEFSTYRPAIEGRPLDAIYVFDAPEAANSLGVESDLAEFRIYFVYRAGAFTPQDLPGSGGGVEDLVYENAWKETPWVKEVSVEYTSRTTTLSRSLLR